MAPPSSLTDIYLVYKIKITVLWCVKTNNRRGTYLLIRTRLMSMSLSSSDCVHTVRFYSAFWICLECFGPLLAQVRFPWYCLWIYDGVKSLVHLYTVMLTTGKFVWLQMDWCHLWSIIRRLDPFTSKTVNNTHEYTVKLAKVLTWGKYRIINNYNKAGWM